MNSNSPFKIHRLMLAGLLAVMITQAVSAATVRGRLDRRLPNGVRAPASGITVTILDPRTGRSTPATTGSDGMYYIYNVRPGTPSLEIWVKPGAEPQKHPINVTTRPVVDIAPIVVR